MSSVDDDSTLEVHEEIMLTCKDVTDALLQAHALNRMAHNLQNKYIASKVAEGHDPVRIEAAIKAVVTKELQAAVQK